MKKAKHNQDIFIDIIIKNITNSDFFPSLTIDEDKQILKKIIFFNNHTLQLNRRGLAILETVFQSHKILFPGGYKITSNDLITLDRACNLPYYISMKNNFLTLFDQELAIILKLYDGDLNMIREMPRDGFF